MNYQKFFNLRTAALSLVLAFFCMAGIAQNSKEKERISDSQATKAAFIAENDKTASFFSSAYGYAIYPSVGKGAVGIGGAHGNGILFKGGAAQAPTSMSQVTVGFQWGGQAYMEVVFFEDSRSYDNFVSGKLKLSGQASAVAVTAGASFDVKYNDGVAIFTMVKGGLMYEASVGGQKFDVKEWKN